MLDSLLEVAANSLRSQTTRNLSNISSGNIQMRFLTENPVAGGWLPQRAPEAGVQDSPRCRETLPLRKEKGPWAGCGLCSPFAMHWCQHRRCGSATHLRNTWSNPTAHPKAQAPQVVPERPMHLPHLWYFTLPSPLPALPCMLGTCITTLSRSSSRDKPQGGRRSKGRTSTPGHHSKQRASPDRLCSTQAAVNETIYCTPISLQPLDPQMASPIVSSALIKAGSSRLLWPLQLGQSGSSSEEGDRVSAVELCAEQGAFVTQETRSHRREKNGNYFGALPSPPQALPMLTPGGINAGRLSACLQPCPCHRTLALTNSLTAAMPALCSRHAHQSRWSQGAVLLKIRWSNAAEKGFPEKHSHLHICSQHKHLYPPPQKTCSMFPPPQAHVALHLCSKHTFAASPSQDLPLLATAEKTDVLSQSFVGK